MTSANLREAFWLHLGFNLKSEAANTYLSYIWWLLEPALLAAVFYLVFELMLNRGGQGFFVFLLLGKIPFLWFSKSVNNAANSIVAGKGLINQIAIPKPFFPLLVVAQDTVKQTIVMVALLAFVSSQGVSPGIVWLLIPLVMLVQMLWIGCASLLAAAITPYLPDFRYLIHSGMTMFMLASGIFYDYREALAPEHHDWFLLNPMALLIESYRDILLRDSAPNFVALAVLCSGLGIAIACLMWFFHRHDQAYARVVIQ